MGCGLVVGPARERVEPCFGHGYAVHVRPVCVCWAGLTGLQRPLLAGLWARERASTGAKVLCVLGFYAVLAHPVRGWPCRGSAERQESGEAIVSFGDG